MIGDPVTECRILAQCEGGEHLFGNVAIGLDVVAAHHGEWRDATLASPPQGFGDEAEDGGRGRRAFDIPGDRRGVEVELAGDVMEVVTAFGDGQRNDARARRGHEFDDALGVVRRVKEVDDRTDHPCLIVAVRVLGDEGVEPVLGFERVAHPLIGRHHPDAADAPVQRQSLIHQLVNVHRLVRAMKAAGAEMNDADAQLRPVVGWSGDAGREFRQGGGAKFQHGNPRLLEWSESRCVAWGREWQQVSSLR